MISGFLTLVFAPKFSVRLMSFMKVICPVVNPWAAGYEAHVTTHAWESEWNSKWYF
jgi:hypothetical protein